MERLREESIVDAVRGGRIGTEQVIRHLLERIDRLETAVAGSRSDAAAAKSDIREDAE